MIMELHSIIINIFYTFNAISFYIHEDDEEEIELCFINCQMNRANRTKTLKLDYVERIVPLTALEFKSYFK